MMKTMSEMLTECAASKDRPKVMIWCRRCASEGKRFSRREKEPAIGFVRYCIDESNTDSNLEPVCYSHRGLCEKTFVRLNEGWSEWLVQSVLTE